MGGRGAKISGMPKNKIKAINSLKQNIKEHQEKIKKAMKTGNDSQAIPHWQTEINAWENKIKQIERRYRK